MPPAYTCAVGLRVKTCWLHNINLVETLKLAKYLWTEIRNLDGILDGIGDFGRTENEILDSMFVQSLNIIRILITITAIYRLICTHMACTSARYLQLIIISQTNLLCKLWHHKACFMYLGVVVFPAHFFHLFCRVPLQRLPKIHILHDKYSNVVKQTEMTASSTSNSLHFG